MSTASLLTPASAPARPQLPPLPAAVVYPCDVDTLQLALAGAFAGYLAPTLVGPVARTARGAWA